MPIELQLVLVSKTSGFVSLFAACILSLRPIAFCQTERSASRRRTRHAVVTLRLPDSQSGERRIDLASHERLALSPVAFASGILAERSVSSASSSVRGEKVRHLSRQID